MAFIPNFIYKVVSYKEDETVTNEEYNELFNLLITQGDSSSNALTTINNDVSKLYSDFSSLSISLNQQIADITAGSIADASVSYNKLDMNMRQKIDDITVNINTIIMLDTDINNLDTTLTNSLITDMIDLADLKLQTELAGRAVIKTNKFYEAPKDNNFVPSASISKINKAPFVVLQDTIANGVTQISANGYGLSSLSAGDLLTIVGCDQNKKPVKVIVPFSSYNHHKELLYLQPAFTYPVGVTTFSTGVGYYKNGSAISTTGVSSAYRSGNNIRIGNKDISIQNMSYVNGILSDEYGRTIICCTNEAYPNYVYIAVLNNLYLADPKLTTINMLDTNIFRACAISGLPADYRLYSINVHYNNGRLLFTYSQTGANTYLTLITLANLKNTSIIPAFTLKSFAHPSYGGTWILLKNHIMNIRTTNTREPNGWYNNAYASLFSDSLTLLTNDIVVNTSNWTNSNGSISSVQELITASGTAVFVTYGTPGNASGNHVNCHMFSIINNVLAYVKTIDLVNYVGENGTSLNTFKKVKRNVAGSSEAIFCKTSWYDNDDVYEDAYRIIDSAGNVSNLNNSYTNNYFQVPSGNYFINFTQLYDMQDTVITGYASAPYYNLPNYYGVQLPLDYRIKLDNINYKCKVFSTGVTTVKDNNTVIAPVNGIYSGRFNKIQINMSEKNLDKSVLHGLNFGGVPQVVSYYNSGYNKLVYSNDITLPNGLNNTTYQHLAYKNTINIQGIAGHKYAVGFTVKAKDSITVKITSGTETHTTITNPNIVTTDQRVNFVITCASSGLIVLELTCSAGGIDVTKGYNFTALNLTQNYGVGSEPTLATINTKWTTDFVSYTDTYLNNEGPTKIIGGVMHGTIDF